MTVPTESESSIDRFQFTKKETYYYITSSWPGLFSSPTVSWEEQEERRRQAAALQKDFWLTIIGTPLPPFFISVDPKCVSAARNQRVEGMSQRSSERWADAEKSAKRAVQVVTGVPTERRTTSRRYYTRLASSVSNKKSSFWSFSVGAFTRDKPHNATVYLAHGRAFARWRSLRSACFRRSSRSVIPINYQCTSAANEGGSSLRRGGRQARRGAWALRGRAFPSRFATERHLGQ